MPTIITRDTDGNEVDVTEAVQVIYDAMHAYMGMASGSLDKEEWDAVLHLSEAAQFPDYANLKRLRELEERQEAERAERRAKYEKERSEAVERGRLAALRVIEEQARVVAEMRAAEPGLANYTDGSLWTLHLMRKNGTA